MMRSMVLYSLAGLVALGIVAGLFLYSLDEGPPHQFVSTFGQKRLKQPVGVAVIGDRVYVSDSGHNRIAVFSLDGTFQKTWGQTGSGPGELNRPMHMSKGPDGNLYVAEYLNDRIQVFSPQGHSLRTIGSSGSGKGEFDAPGGVDVDEDGNLYVADFYNQRVQKLSPQGEFLRQWGNTGVKGFLRYSYFNYPNDVAFLPDGSWVVADAYNDRVKHYSADGTRLSVWGGLFGLNIPGPFDGWFKVATGVGTSPGGLVYVADFYNDRIQVMGPDGDFRTLFGEAGTGQGRFDRPTDVAFGPGGRIYVPDYGNDRIHIWEVKQP